MSILPGTASNDSHYFDCQCGSDDHTIRFRYFDDAVAGRPLQDEPTLYVTVHLRDGGGFWSRCWAAFKYVFGRASRYGHWEEALVRVDDCPRLRALLDLYESDSQRYMARFGETHGEA